MCYDIFVKIYVRTIQKTWSAVAETPFARIIEENSEERVQHFLPQTVPFRKILLEIIIIADDEI